ncbi:hypothetical protein [Sphingomonas daechungensis]|uniref:hypothetical protein n=1 Tax=Sphingomonas daechungensis TaxID=1176646 RepID=UPI00378478BD
MVKRVAGILAVILLSLPAVAAVKEKPESRVQELLACQAITANEERLACYDRAMGSLKQALSQGTMVLKEKKVPLAMEGVVKASGYWGGSSAWVLLDNGDRWSIQPSKSRREPPPPGTEVKLKRTLMGTYWMSGKKLPETEAEFLGHEG